VGREENIEARVIRQLRLLEEESLSGKVAAMSEK
jgi:hypothetical protein